MATWVLIIVACCFVVFLITRTKGLNEDILQKQIAAEIVKFANSDWSPAHKALFHGSLTLLFMQAGIEKHGKRSTRLTHGLSMARPMISESGYQNSITATKEFLRIE